MVVKSFQETFQNPLRLPEFCSILLKWKQLDYNPAIVKMGIKNAVEPFITACPLGFLDHPPFVLKIICNSNLWLGIPREIRSSFFSSQHSGEFYRSQFHLKQIFFYVILSANDSEEKSQFIVGFIYLYISSQVCRCIKVHSPIESEFS